MITNASELRVLFAAAPRLVCRVFRGVDFELFGRSECEVNVELVVQPHEVEEDVGELLRHFGARLGAERGGLGVREPLEMLEELGGLNAQGHREILRRMKLVPVALCREAA